MADDLEEEMRRSAEAFVKAAAERGYTLDYSIASLEVLDGMLDHLFSVRSPIGRMRGKLAIRKFEPMVRPVGAYTGETLRRATGAAWAVHEEFGEGLHLPPDQWIFPLAKAEKRFVNGHEDSLAFFGEVMADMHG